MHDPPVVRERCAQRGRAADRRARAGRLNQIFFTNGGAEATENALRMARLHTGRHKVLAAYRSYHGATAGSIAMTGDPRRWAQRAGHAGSGPVLGPYLYRSRVPRDDAGAGIRTRACNTSATCSMVEGAAHRRGDHPRDGRRHQRHPRAPPGYLAGVRQICDEFGILLIADEVMAGFGRCGEWFAVDHWDVTPDLITFAKGVNSGYVPLGGVIISDAIAATFQERPYPGG